MRKTALVAGLLAAGFILKVGLVEAERYVSSQLVDSCFSQYNEPMSQEQKNECYSSPCRDVGYRIVAVLNFQPELWKNIKGRCVEAQDNAEQYFECGWWNRVAF